MNIQNYNLVLASKSPRRQELLKNAGYKFSVIPADIDESKIEEEYILSNINKPYRLVERLSYAKAFHIARELSKKSLSGEDMGGLLNASSLVTKILAADTVVSIDGKILGKPKDSSDAYNMLSSLSGRTHKVYTGFTILPVAEGPCGGFLLPEEVTYYFGEADTLSKSTEVITKSVCTEVTFYELSSEEIEWYIETKDPFDKAGGYGIQSLGVRLVKSINGDYNNVVGLPLAEVMRAL